MSVAVCGKTGKMGATKMGYAPIYDGSFDVCFSELSDLTDTLEFISDNKMVITKWYKSARMEWPEVTLRGTRKQMLAWINFWNDDLSSWCVAPDGMFTEDELQHHIWKCAVETFDLKFVA